MKLHSVSKQRYGQKLAQHMASKLDIILKANKYQLSATNAPDVVEEEHKLQSRHIAQNFEIISQKKPVVHNDEGNLEDGSADAELSEIMQANHISVTKKNTTI